MKFLLRFLYGSFLFACLTVLNSAEISAQTQTAPVAEIAKSISEKKQPDISVEENKAAAPVDAPKKSSASEYSTILTRAGVQSSQTLPISLNEAIRKALENNNDIEVARTDVRFQETQLRSLLGTYDPVFSVTPTFSRSSTTGSTA